MTHGSLFSGIGGFDLAAEWMGWENKFHCEWNPFGQKVLKHHFPNADSYSDITKTDFTKYEGQIDIITGGFPCQPYSTAGLRKGKADERHLFPEMLRVIGEVKPRWVIGENVRGLVSWGGNWYSRRCMLTWKGKVMKSKRLLFLLQASTHRTDAKESGLLLTPTTRKQVQDLDKFKARMEKYPNGTKMPNLATQVSQMLPTPQASDFVGTVRKNDYSLRHLEHNTGWANKMLKTPTASDKNGGCTRSNPKMQMGSSLVNQMHHICKTTPGKTSQLNPHFVMEMMGFPRDWILLPFQNGEQNQSKQEEMQ